MDRKKNCRDRQPIALFNHRSMNMIVNASDDSENDHEVLETIKEIINKK